MRSNDFTTDGEEIDSVSDDERPQCWADGRLVQRYLRLSRDLRRRGFDERTVHRMGRVEEELRARGIDPDDIARTVEEEYSQ